MIVTAETPTTSPFRDNILAGRVALVTGGGSGIGFEIASALAQHGASVVIMGRREKFLNEAVSILTAKNLNATSFAGDVRSYETCEKAVAFVVETYGKLDTVVCGAAGNFLAVSEELSSNGFGTVMEIDAVGTFNTCRASFLELKRSTDGIIINVTATMHYGATWWQLAPSAAKAAVDAMTRNLALEWAEFGIRVVGIAPGPTSDTPGTAKLSGMLPKKLLDSAVQKVIPLGRLGTKNEMALTAVFLCFNKFVTGTVIVVDGGEVLKRAPLLPRSSIASVSRRAEPPSRKMGPQSTSKL